MALRIYNTLTGGKEEFKPVSPGQVKMYVCGVTVYDRCHMGHARAGVAFDFVYRSLAWMGYRVTYVRNFTDVDDKIINRANERGISCRELVDENIVAFYEDMDALYLKRPTHEPRATAYIEKMIALISQLESKGLAYAVDGDVFFSVRSFKPYGALSGKNIEDLMEGARVEVNDRKRDPLDFALWKSAKPGEPKWPSPWGEGRPGWHIECSAMSADLLGNNFDIHGGGKDLVFPHHENEVAQSHGAHGVPPANYWMHNGFVAVNKEKMSKSLGNFFTIRDVLKSFDPEAVRLYLLSTHYRSPIDFADEYLREAERQLDRFYSAFARAKELLGDEPPTEMPPVISEKVLEALEDDFNSAAVMAILNDVVTQCNAVADKFKRKNQEQVKRLAGLYASLTELAGILGVLNRDPQEYLDSVKTVRLKALGLTPEEVEKAIEDRNTARAEKDFAKADEIRDRFAAKGIEFKDGPNGTAWGVRVA